MKTLFTVLAILLLTCIVSGQTYQIDWYVIGSGGGHSESGAYSIDGTIGQPIVGMSSSANYRVEAGFWVGAGASSGYEYLPGDVNMFVGAWPAAYLSGDVTYLVNYFRGIASSVPCKMHNPLAPSPDPSPYYWASADVNGDCKLIGSDVTKLVGVFRGLYDPSYCPDYPPAWLTPADLPAEPPLGWPNCEVVLTNRMITEVKVGK